MNLSAARSNPSLAKYRITRKGRKLQVSDDQRTLLALPKDVPERTWAEVLQKEENDMVCFEIREEIFEEAMRIGYENYMEKQTSLFAVNCAAQAWMKLIDWHFYRHDPGEDPSATPLCYIPKRAESWIPDVPPEPSPKDTWSRQDLKVVEECVTDEALPVCPSADSIDFPHVDEIPKECWFPGNVALYYDNAGNLCSQSEHMRALAVASDAEMSKYRPSHDRDYDDDSERSTVNIGDESEVLQKVTDYTNGEVSAKESASGLKHPTPVDGSLHGAGDSTVGLVKHHRKSIIKSRFGLSRMSIKNQLPPLDTGSGSKFSIISDCRLRNLRLETQFEVSSEHLESPPGGMGSNNKRR